MTIYYYEGLGGVFGRWLYKGQIKRIKKLYPRVKVVKRKWWWPFYKKITDLDCIVMGHSFGAVRALKDTLAGELLLLFDPRITKKTKLQVNNRTVNCVNYWQRHKGLHGVEVQGADNHELHDVVYISRFTAKYVDHTNIVKTINAHPYIDKALNAWL